MSRLLNQLFIPVIAGKKAWNPLQPLSGGLPSLLIDPDTIAGNDGDALASVLSAEGHAYDFAQADEAKRPLLKKGANGINGHNTILGDGTNDLLVYAAGDISTASLGTIFAVYRLTDATKNNNMILTSSDQISTARYLQLQGSQSLTVRTALVNQNNNAGQDILNTTKKIDPVFPTLLVLKSNGTAYSSRLNGYSQALTVAAGSNTGDWFGDSANRDNFALFGFKDTGEAGFMKGDIAYILMYDFETTAEDDAKVEAFLQKRFGLTYSYTGFTATNLAFNVADYAPNGDIYAGVGAVIKKSTDDGANWTDVYTIPGTPTICIQVFCASNGYVYVSAYDPSSGHGLYRSVDAGANWTKVITNDANCCIWGIDEDSNGNLFAGEYSKLLAGQMQIWKSTDDGANWVRKYINDAGTTVTADHIHDIRVDPSTDWVYATTGDAEALILRSKDAGETWTEIYAFPGVEQGLAIGFLGGKVYIGSDSHPNGVWRFTDNSDSVTLEVATAFPTAENKNVFCACWYGSYLAMGTYYNQSALDGNIWITDGTNWSIVNTMNGTTSLHGYQRMSKHSLSGVFLVSRTSTLGAWEVGLKMDMTTAVIRK